jgi:acetylornithine deacetylase/succinyl-diaminopimelate desuccinylase-like protein
VTHTVDERLSLLYALGGGSGANRVAGGDAERAACELVAQWLEESGLEVERDVFGNVIGRLRGGEPELPEVWAGSHVDSVPAGGRYDGALGVVAAIEAVRAVGPSRRTLGVVAFRDEERGCNGSSAFVQDAEGLPGGFLELHVEQGPVLARSGAPLGIVSGVVGMVRATRTFEGAPGHAGTVAMVDRSDALVAAAEYVLHVREVAAGIEGAVATVGGLDVEPGAVNVIPGRVTLTVDARAPDLERLNRLTGALELEPTFTLDPVTFAEAPRSALGAELEHRGIPQPELLSGAGHDASVLARNGVPTGMLFVRSLNGGVSHSPDELSSADDIGLAVDVLTGALLRLTRGD